MSIFFKRDLFGLDIGDGRAFGEGVASGKDVCFISWGCLDDRLWWCFPICGDACSEQPKRFFWASRSPTEGTEKVVVNDGAVELGFLEWGSCVSILYDG